MAATSQKPDRGTTSKWCNYTVLRNSFFLEQVPYICADAKHKDENDISGKNGKFWQDLMNPALVDSWSEVLCADCQFKKYHGRKLLAFWC